MFSREHYVAIADKLAAEASVNRYDPDRLTTVQNVMRSLADTFEQDNERFNRAKFYSAVGFGADGFTYGS